MRKIHILSTLLICSLWVSGQAPVLDLSLSRDTITIGESVDVTVKVFQNINVPGGRLELDLNQLENLAYEQDTNALEEFADIALISSGNPGQFINDNVIKIPLDQINSGQFPWQESFNLGFYSIGAFHIKAPTVLSLGGDTLSSGGGSILFVNPPEGFGQDSTKVINELKPIIEVESSWRDYLIYLYWLAGLLLAYFIGRFILKKIKSSNKEVAQPIVEEEIVKEPAHVIALRALEQLKEGKSWIVGDIKGYQSDLTTTIRQYLEDRYSINALEMTTSEIITDIQKESSMEGQVDALKNILTVADMVKFAKAKPSEDIHEMFLEQAFEFVHKTKSSRHVE